MATITREQYRDSDSFPCGYEVSLIGTIPDVPVSDGIRDFVTVGTYEQACEVMERWAARMAHQVDANAVDFAAIYVNGCDDERSYQIQAVYID